MNRCLRFIPIINLAVTNYPNIVNEINQASILDAYQSDINSMQSRTGAAF